ncbi:MAG: hypothetical protein AAGF11_32845 [Myxococcota bacterium]
MLPLVLPLVHPLVVTLVVPRVVTPVVPPVVPLVVPLVVTVGGVDAPGPELDEIEARADSLVRQGKLDEAFALLEQAYYAEPDPEPRLLFGMGVIELERGNCETAVGYLGRFLATSPREGAADKAREVIAYCEAQLRSQVGPVPEPVSPPNADAQTDTEVPTPVASEPDEVATTEATSELAEVPTEDPPGPTPWYRDGLGWGLLGTGVAVTAVGAGLLGQAQGDVRAAEGSEDEASFDRSLARVDTLRAVGGSLTGVGIGLLVGAVIRYGVVARRNRRSGVVMQGITGGVTWVAPGAGGLSLRTSFRF